MTTSTFLLAQLLGLMLLSLGASLLFQKHVFLKMLRDVTENRSTLFMVGIVLFIGGLLIVLTHNVWNGSYLAFAVTLIGWVLTLRGLASMFFPAHDLTKLVKGLKVEELSWLYGAIIVIVGGCLTYGGFAG